MNTSNRGRLLLFAGLALVSCASVPQRNYRDKAIHFEVTTDFEIGRVSFTKKNQSTYIPIYPSNDVAYAKFSIIWLPGHSDMDYEIWNYSDAFSSLYASDPNGKPEYSEVKEIEFASNKGKYIEYKVVHDDNRVGSFTVFYCNNLTVILCQHTTTEGMAMTQRCRELVERTLTCVIKN